MRTGPDIPASQAMQAIAIFLTAGSRSGVKEPGSSRSAIRGRGGGKMPGTGQTADEITVPFLIPAATTADHVTRVKVMSVTDLAA
jgi:hypothetical protein